MTIPWFGLVTKWCPHRHGISPEEVSYINYMKTKTFVVYCTIGEPNTVLLEELDDIPSDCSIVLLKKMYYFQDRCFGIQNFGLQTFQKLWREYYKKKKNFMKNIKNLQHRELYGRYPPRQK